MALILAMVEAVRAEIGEEMPLHVFGIGKPDLIETLFARNVDSVDSSWYVKLAAESRAWRHPGLVVDEPTPLERRDLAMLNQANATQCQFPLSVARVVFPTQGIIAATHQRLPMPRQPPKDPAV